MIEINQQFFSNISSFTSALFAKLAPIINSHYLELEKGYNGRLTWIGIMATLIGAAAVFVVLSNFISQSTIQSLEAKNKKLSRKINEVLARALQQSFDKSILQMNIFIHRNEYLMSVFTGAESLEALFELQAMNKRNEASTDKVFNILEKMILKMCPDDERELNLANITSVNNIINNPSSTLVNKIPEKSFIDLNSVLNKMPIYYLTRVNSLFEKLKRIEKFLSEKGLLEK